MPAGLSHGATGSRLQSMYTASDSRPTRRERSLAAVPRRTSQRKSAGVLLAAAGACLALAAPAAAEPRWLDPFDIAPADVASTAPTAVIAPSGELAVAWRSASASGPVLPQVRRLPGGTLVPAPALRTGSGAEAPVLAASPDGTMYAAWSTIDPGRLGKGAITVARLGADGSIAASAVVSGDDDAATPSLAVAADATLGVAWLASDDAGLDTVHAAVGHIGGFAVASVSTEDKDAADPAVAFDVPGSLRVTWSGIDGRQGRVKLVSIARSGAVSPAVPVSPAGVDAGEPAVAVSESLGVAVAWTETDQQDAGTVKLALASPDGSFPAIAQTAPGGGDAGSPQLAVTIGGRLRLAWVCTREEVGRALVADADAGLLSPAATSVSGPDNVTLVRLAFAPRGDGVAVWRRSLDPSRAGVADIRAAGYDGSGPQLVDASIPASTSAGTPTAYSVRALDTWSAVTGISWSFGDTGTGAGEALTHVFDAAASPASVAVQATDALGNISRLKGTTDVRPALAQTPSPPVGAAPPAALRLDAVSADFACVRYLGARAARSRAAFAFTLSEPATATLRFQRRSGSAPKRRCPATRVKGAAGRYVDATTVTVPAAGGPSRVEVGPLGEKVGRAARAGGTGGTRHTRAGSGRLEIALAAVTGRRALAPGTYLARISAVTADGRRSPESFIKFWILNGRRSA